MVAENTLVERHMTLFVREVSTPAKSFKIVIGYETIDRFSDNINIHWCKWHTLSLKIHKVQVPVKYPWLARFVQCTQKFVYLVLRRMRIFRLKGVNHGVCVVFVHEVI